MRRRSRDRQATVASDLRVAVTGWELFSHRCVELLRSRGVDAFYAPPPPRRRPGPHLAYLRQLASADVVLGMGGRTRLARAQQVVVRLGIPMVVAWLGSDVLTSGGARAHIGRRVWNWCDAPWLQRELEDAGLPGVEPVPMAFCRVPDEMPPLPEVFRVLAYAPERRVDFYRLDWIVELARRFPDVPFDVVATGPEHLVPANVHCLGWVEDMDPLFRRASVVVRPTVHDGLAYMVVEMLAYGRYAVWTYAVPGANQVTDVDEAESVLRRLVEAHRAGTLQPNVEGRRWAEGRYAPSVVGEWLERRLRTIAATRWRRVPSRPVRWTVDAVRRLVRVPHIS